VGTGMEQKWARELVGILLGRLVNDIPLTHDYKITATISLLKNRLLISTNKPSNGDYLIRKRSSGSPILLLPDGGELCFTNKQFAKFCAIELKKLGHDTQILQLVE
jgi:hypothetical protein